MSLSDLIASDFQIPSFTAQYGNTFFSKVNTIRVERAYDQQVATCNIVLPKAPAAGVVPDDIHLVKVFMGYSDNERQVFAGYLDDIVIGRFPDTWTLVCRDNLGKAQDTWLDDEGVEYNQKQAEEIVTDLLSKAGLSVSAGVSSFTVADIQPAKFSWTSVLDAAKQVSDLIGWRIWAAPDGTVNFQYQRPRPGTGAITWTYRRGLNILHYDFTETVRNLRNKIIIRGWEDIRAVAYADSPYVADPPKYRLAGVSSELIDVQAMATQMAGWMLEELNHLMFSAPLTVVGNPLLDVGKKVRVIDVERDISMEMFVFSLAHHMNGDTGEFLTEFTAVAVDDASHTINFEDPPPDEPPEWCEGSGPDTGTPGQIICWDGTNSCKYWCDPPPPDVYPDGPEAGLWRTHVYLATDAKGVFYTTNFTGPGGAMPTWTAVNSGLPSLSVIKFLGDPFAPGTTQYCFVRDPISEQYDIYKRAGGAWSKILDSQIAKAACGFTDDPPSGVEITDFDVTINAAGYIGAVGRRYVGGNYQLTQHYLYSTDYGASWASVQISSNPFLNAYPRLRMGAFGGGNVLYCPMFSQGVFGQNTLYVSTDFGASWAPLHSNTIDWELIAFDMDAYQETAYFWGGNGTTSPDGLNRMSDNGASYEQIHASTSIPVNHYSLHALYPGDGTEATTLRFLTRESGVNKLYQTTDAAASWLSAVTLAVNERELGLSIVHDAPNKIYFIADFGATAIAHIYASEDEGLTMDPKAGTDRTSGSTTGIPQNAGNVSGILQVWDV